jgi:predicted ATP-dependent serine protease
MFLPTVASYVVGAMVLERLSTGVDGLDALIEGGIPRGFFVAVTGEPWAWTSKELLNKGNSSL